MCCYGYYSICSVRFPAVQRGRSCVNRGMPARAGIIGYLHCPPVVPQVFRAKRMARVSTSEGLLGFDRAAEDPLLDYQVPPPAPKCHCSTGYYMYEVSLHRLRLTEGRFVFGWHHMLSPVLFLRCSGEGSAPFSSAGVLRLSRRSGAASTSERRHFTG